MRALIWSLVTLLAGAGILVSVAHELPPARAEEPRQAGAKQASALGEQTTAQNQDEQPEADSLERDYAEELPRIKPLEPAAALASFAVAPGFQMQLVASEPVVVDPVAMAFDEQGRLFVIEMRDYSEDDALRLGRVRLLEDRDADGQFETSSVYAEELAWPTALVCFDGGLFVGAAPDIFYLKDTDGDGQADERRVVFTGFGKSNVQGLMNSFHWDWTIVFTGRRAAVERR